MITVGFLPSSLNLLFFAFMSSGKQRMIAYSTIASTTYQVIVVNRSWTIIAKYIKINNFKHVYNFKSISHKYFKYHTIHRHVVVQTVKPQSPERTGLSCTTITLICIRTSISVTSVPTLPGWEVLGIKKLNQLNATIIAVGMNTWKIIRRSFLFQYTTGSKNCHLHFFQLLLFKLS